MASGGGASFLRRCMKPSSFLAAFERARPGRADRTLCGGKGINYGSAVSFFVHKCDSLPCTPSARCALGARSGALPRARGFASRGAISTADTTQTMPNRDKEATLWAQGLARVAGVDEVGRSPLAGPVVAVACVLPADADAALLDGIRSSEKMTEAARDAVFERLVHAEGVHFAVSIRDHKRIDEINILASTMEAMSEAVKGLSSKPDYVLIDGKRCPTDLGIPAEGVVKGDLECTNIAAASIIAKVTRDRMMHAYHKRWPEYDFATVHTLSLSHTHTRTHTQPLTHTHTHTRKHTHTHTCKQTHTHTHTHKHTHTDTHTHTHPQARPQTNTHTNKHTQTNPHTTHTYTNTYTHTQTHTRTHTHTHIHTYARITSGSPSTTSRRSVSFFFSTLDKVLEGP